MLRELSPEEQLCCILCRKDLSEDHIDSARALAQTGVEWERILGFLERSRVFALAYRHLSGALAREVPHSVLRRLGALTWASMKRTEVMADELATILAAFEKEGLRVVPLKGPVLMGRIWGDHRLGVSSDLDLMVSHSDNRRAVEVLFEQGYRVRSDYCGDPFGNAKPWRNVVFVRRHNSGVLLTMDLQMSFISDRVARPLAGERVWKSLQSKMFRGVPVWVPSDGWGLTYLAVHSLTHLFTSLYWVAQFHGLKTLCPDAWPGAIRCAHEIGAVRELLLVNQMSEMVLGDEMTSPEGTDRRIQRLVLSPFREARQPFMNFHAAVSLRPGIISKIAYLFSILFSPRPKDLALFPLPRWLYPAYSVVRPAAVMWRALSGRYWREFSAFGHGPKRQ